MSKWQPIETAPRDGTIVLLANSASWVGTGYYHFEDNRGWFMAGTHWTDYCDGSITGTTHWMPLPKPPGEAT